MRRKRILFSLLLLTPLAGRAQVLARPGWAGSGVAPEAWWRRAVLYRLDPSRFQDSNGDGRGDLHGVVERLAYLQSVGIDALLLDGNVNSEGQDDLGDLIREASTHHIRIVLTVSQAEETGDRSALLQTVHGWLSAGAAGVLLPKMGETADANSGYAALVAALGTVMRGLPGERVLLTDPVPADIAPAPRPSRVARHTDARGPSAPRVGQLVTAAAFPAEAGSVTALRTSLVAAASVTSEAHPLLRFASDPPTDSPNAAAAGALLLASRGAAVFDFGDEIGLDLYPATTSRADATAEAGLPVMQWTPSNHTLAPVEDDDKTKRTAASETVFGAYHPYQPMVHRLAGSLPPPARVAVDPNIAPDLPAPDSLPGFTAGSLRTPPADGGKLNVVREDRDPKSLLNFYRQLIGLHQDNATLRNGTQAVLNHDAEGALVWLRRAPEGSRTVANVLVAANLTDRPVTMDLDSEIEGLGMRGGALRPLCSFSSNPITGATTAHLTLPPHAVFLGEIYHAGSGSEPAAHERRGGRHPSRHRGRG